MFAQSIADREGPGVSLVAEFANSRAIAAFARIFHVEDDAYVLVGHIDADGMLRIAFPPIPATTAS